MNCGRNYCTNKCSMSRSIQKQACTMLHPATANTASKKPPKTAGCQSQVFNLFYLPVTPFHSRAARSL